MVYAPGGRVIRKSYLKRSQKPISRSAIRKKTRKPIRKVNPKAKAKRVVRYKKMLASPEYRAARKEAMERAGNQCEGMLAMRIDPVSVKVIGDGISNAAAWFYTYTRCTVTESLHAHHLRYPKSRPIEASDLKILCRFHHEFAESQKLGKTRMF
jgi:hypothetical protein